jgi:hypothetical protein
MTNHDLIDCVAELLNESPGELRDADVTSELNLQGCERTPGRTTQRVAPGPRARPARPNAPPSAGGVVRVGDGMRT